MAKFGLTFVKLMVSQLNIVLSRLAFVRTHEREESFGAARIIYSQSERGVYTYATEIGPR